MADDGISTWTRGYKDDLRVSTEYIPWRHTEVDIPDHLSATGAVALADALLKYWMQRGHFNVRVEVIMDRLDTGHHHTLWSVRSNLVRGLPPPKEAS